MPSPLTVSTPMGDFLDSATQAEMRDALGTIVSNPLMAFVRTTGSNTSGDGTAGKPYLTLQKAYDVGFRVFDVGLGISDEIHLTQDDELFFQGHGGGASGTIGVNSGAYIYSEGYNVTVWDLGTASMYLSVVTKHYTRTWDGIVPAGNAKIYGGYIGSVNVGGRDALMVNYGDPGYNGQSGGEADVWGPAYFYLDVAADGGSGLSVSDDYAAAGNGGNAGIIRLWQGAIGLSSLSYIRSLGGAAGTNAGIGGDGTAGSDGTIICRGCDTGLVTPDVGAGTLTKIGCIINGVFYAS